MNATSYRKDLGWHTIWMNVLDHPGEAVKRVIEETEVQAHLIAHQGRLMAFPDSSGRSVSDNEGEK